MQKKKLNTGLSILVAAAFLLAACGQSTPVAPTLDANAIYTQAAATVASGMAMTEAANPSATPAPATSTPTNIIPTLNATQPQTTLLATQSTLAIGTKAAGTPSGTKLATVAVNLTKTVGTPLAPAATSAAPTSNDKAAWYSQFPTDGTVEKKNDKFTVGYVIKNTGKTTWTTAYTLRFYAGDQMNSPASINLPKTVPPNDSVQLSFELTAPGKTGEYNSMWVLTNADGVNFYSIYLKINVN